MPAIAMVERRVVVEPFLRIHPTFAGRTSKSIAAKVREW
jgi:hypothetical protein